jgi:LCP family protein required for cell wall assembly
VLSAVLPGSAQAIAGNRRVGVIALRCWAVLLALAGVTLIVGLASWTTVAGLGVRPAVLSALRVLFAVVAVAWFALLVDAWRLGRPAQLAGAHRWIVTGTASALALVVCAPLLWGAHVVAVQRDLITTVFAAGSGVRTTDGRLNVLLLGGDAGPTRIGTRPDSITLASVDVSTGRTVMFSLPRNLEDAQFPPGSALHGAYPTGFDDMLNAVYTYGTEHPELLPGAADPGAEATKEAVAGTLGIPVHHYVMVNLKGFRDLIDALGGITLTVEARVPIGGGSQPVSGWIEPGKQRLDGYHALWYTRSREGSSDYVRMGRQRCVMAALLEQAEPVTVLRRIQAVASSTKALVRTDLPQKGLPDMVELAAKVRTSKVSSVQFVPPMIVTG